MKVRIFAMAALAATLPVANAGAQFTFNSPTGQPLPSSVTSVGGIVADLIGLNGSRIVAQRAASTLFVGNTPSTPIFAIGTQTGFTSSLLGLLGGGIAQASFRVTLFDGDTRSGNFDFNDNFLLVNGVRVGNFSSVNTIETNGVGAPIGGGNFGLGFGNNILNTGFFYTTNAANLSTIFAAMSGGSIVYSYEDIDPGDQFLDFTRGVDGGLIDNNVPPVVVPPNPNVIPEPATNVLLATGLLALGAVVRRRRRNACQ